MEELQTPAGRELDALIAERVMGWKRWRFPNKNLYWLDTPEHDFMPDGPGVIEANGDEPPYRDAFSQVPRYSTAIVDTWKIIEHFTGPAKDGRCVAFSITEPDEWSCEIGGNDEGPDSFYASGPTAPLAICRAALQASVNSTPQSPRQRLNALG